MNYKHPRRGSYSCLDLACYLAAVILLIPLLLHLVQVVLDQLPQ